MLGREGSDFVWFVFFAVEALRTNSVDCVARRLSVVVVFGTLLKFFLEIPRANSKFSRFHALIV